MSDNEPWSAITHLIATLLAIAALVLLIVFSSDAWQLVSFSIYGATMVLLYLASTLYHFFYRKKKKVKEVFRRIDHSMIYALIAGTYTPLMLVYLRGALGWTVFGIIWGLAITGIVFKSTGLKITEFISTGLYVIMGWFIIITIKYFPLKAALLLLLGGIFYTVGAVFYYIGEKHETKLFSWHEYFHILTMLGSFCHFLMMWLYLL